MNSALRQKWGDAYRKFLADTFKKEEILYLADHIDDVVEIMSNTRLPSGDAQVLIAAREQLKYMLSSDETFIRIFVSALAAGTDCIRGCTGLEQPASVQKTGIWCSRCQYVCIL